MQSNYIIAQVIVDQNSHQTDRIFDYIIPAHLQQDICKGMRVVVPFGKGNKRLEAYILNIDKKKIDGSRYKEIIEAIDYEAILSEEQIKMILWMKNKYLCKYIEAIHCLIPTGIVQKERKMINLIDQNWRTRIAPSQNKQRAILEVLEAQGGGTQPLENLEKEVNFKEIYSTIKNLAAEKIIEIQYDLSSRIKVKTEEYAELKVSHEAVEGVLLQLKGAKKQAEILNFLKDMGRYQTTAMLKELKTTRGPLKAVVEKGFVELMEEEIHRDPFANSEVTSFPKLNPTPEQQQVIDEISFALQENKPETYLIHGITGSGKTEIYLRLIEEVISQGKQGIVLVPEISLTPQTVERFRGRFGEGIALLHSSLSEGERYDEWRRISEGKVNIVIGARSAVFAPLKNLGIIIIDEEHEYTYKSEQNPKYHAAEIAAYRSTHEGAVVILGSATPSLESYYKTEVGTVHLMTLKKRPQQSKLPKVEVVDMKRELEEGNQGILSRRLMTLVNENLKNKKQTILFLNRRGFSTFVSCKGCGHVVKCQHCDISMTLHMPQNHLKCHYCGERQFSPSVCPECGSETIKFMGAGTQRLEKMIEELFPTAKIGRMDVDSTSQKGSHAKILGSFRRGEIDILIGTQMISKGLDFPNVTLVGIISVDATLNLPDFRGAEKTFQLITQVAGRAGRGMEEGLVILQTLDPNHYSIRTASRHDYGDFYKEEIMIRREFEYPPFTNLISINFSGKKENEVAAYAEKMANMIKYVLQGKGCIKINDVLLGPNESVISRINQRYRFQIILKDQHTDFSLLKGIAKYFFIQHREKYVPKSIAVSIDTNPYNMM
ncbi:primosomal protein N' [Alkaliphilus hydrothermalis]|uniref:Replication restart protein PriA n=1 Tax=Alkaliphilus hydrothermalis TaxID=1482730 RepID=A0ABS2NPK3_9FIRM|nr:primosomal protein N' (replication factor Y) [Alkaliphilus hydrothermalis]